MKNETFPELFRANPHLHAYILLSPDKNERTRGAKDIAKAMLCENISDSFEPCGNCPCCIKVEAGTHPDCIFVSGEEKTGVDDIRKIEDEAYLAPNEASCKVFVLSDTDEYNVQSQNALLKILEEPPHGVKFLLTASSKAPILTTVRSRVCTLGVNPKGFEEILGNVKHERPELDDEMAKSMAFFVMAYDSADIKSIDDKAFSENLKIAQDFLSGSDTSALLLLPKKREELMQALQVLMLCCAQIAVSKGKNASEMGILSQNKLSACASKTSMKRANSLYDVFEKAFLLCEEYANVNALLAYIWQNAK